MPCAGKQIHLTDSSLVPIKIFLARRNKKESLICKTFLQRSDQRKRNVIRHTFALSSDQYDEYFAFFGVEHDFCLEMCTRMTCSLLGFGAFVVLFCL